MQIMKPTPEDLAPAIADIAKGKLAAWAQARIAALPIGLEKRPLFYRGYGPWWWLVKKALVDSNYFEFGDALDAEVVDALDYGDTGLNLLAACIYYDQQEAMGALMVQQHTLDGPNGEPVEYLLEDVDMEWREKGRQAEG